MDGIPSDVARAERGTVALVAFVSTTSHAKPMIRPHCSHPQLPASTSHGALYLGHRAFFVRRHLVRCGIRYHR